MFRKPAFWGILFIASLACIYFSARYFSRAFPIVSIDLRMNREAALAGARAVATHHQLPPEGYRQAASFGGDQEVQNFVELEGGGTSAFKAMMGEGLYHPYKWSVRHFKPGETKETRLYFTPRGDPYGFSVKLPENASGAALSEEKALEIAERSATEWQADLSPYRLVEKSKEVRPSGRIDHTFVYERPDKTVGEGRYRLRLIVRGDKFTELVHFVKVPEAFTRRYEQMRSANSVISVAGSIAMVILYLIGGCCAGLFFLMRQRWIIWRAPLLWSLFIAFLQLLASINQWPLVWLDYDTALSSQSFVVREITMMVLSFLMYTGLFALSFMAAESLSRRAFPEHLQQWRLWGPSLAGTKDVLGRTVAGYLLVGMFFGYEVFLYIFTSKMLGWWTPSDMLIQPDILASYFPWLTPIATAAQAGFWEESLFRAVPLAAAALLGTRFGKRGWWIAGAMILQALIFGSGHTLYPNQPSYARLVELVLPSFLFGGLYLRFGLLVSIVLHFTYDVVWMALPLFVAASPGIWLDRGMVILLALTPLWVILAGRLRSGRSDIAPETMLNRAWQPEESVRQPEAVQAVTGKALSPIVVRVIPLVGLAGLLLWVIVTPFKSDAPGLNIGRREAQEIARRSIEQRGIRLSPSWTILTSIQTSPDEDDRFVWQTAGKETYRKLMNEYLAPPHWSVRAVRFEGDVADRAEEYGVAISDAKGPYRFRHTLPEDRPGKSIGEQEARELAWNALRRELGMDPSILKEVSSVPAKQKARTDWLFTFSDPRPPRLPQGEKRLAVQIGGDEVIDAYRFVHVPEEWERQETDRSSVPSTVRSICVVLAIVAVMVGCGLGIFAWSRKRFAVSTFLLLSSVLLVLHLSGLLNSLPEMKSRFSTAQPFKIQMFILVGLAIVGAILSSTAMGLIAGLLHHRCMKARNLQGFAPWAVGISLGAIAAGLSSLSAAISPSLSPSWANLDALSTYLPVLDFIVDPLTSFLTESTVALLIFVGVDHLTHAWSRHKTLCGALLFLFGPVIAGARSLDSLPSWLLSGAIVGAFLIAAYWLIARYSLPVVLIASGIIQILGAVRRGVTDRVPASLPGIAIGILIAAIAVWWWYRRFATTQPDLPDLPTTI